MSSHELEARIKNLEDIEEIRKLQYTYAYLIDTRQFDKVPDLFADDFVAEWGFAGPYKTREELREFFTGPIAATLAMSAHQMLAPIIEIQGDKATGTWYLLVAQTNVTPHGEVAVWIQGKYENEYVRMGGDWKFSCLGFKMLFGTPYEDGWVKTRMMNTDIGSSS